MQYALRVVKAVDTEQYHLGITQGLPDLPCPGADVFPAALARVRPGGRLIQFGQASRVAPVLDFFSFFAGPKQASVEHFDYTVGDRTYGDELRVLVDLVASGRLHPEIGYEGSWDAAAQAVEALRAREVRGNVVLTVGV